MNAIKHLIFGIILGGLFTFWAGYYFIVGPSEQRIGQLTEQLRSVESTNNILRESVSIRQGYLDEAKRIIGSSSDSITKLRNILKVLQKSDSTNNLSNKP